MLESEETMSRKILENKYFVDLTDYTLHTVRFHAFFKGFPTKRMAKNWLAGYKHKERMYS